jgi:hypothetical protein
MATLNQVVAVEKGLKERVYSKVTELHKACMKADLFNGFSKEYRPKDEADGEKLPPENKKVQFRADAVIKEISRGLEELFNITLSKDRANTQAKADIEIGGQVLATGVPATYLLFLEKQLTDIRKFVAELPELDENQDWEKDTVTGLYRTNAVETHRTKKLPKVIILHPPTKEHPAQTQLLQEDLIVGFWSTVHRSGAIEKPVKDAMLGRVEALIKAVKYAREEANQKQESTEETVGGKILGYIFND